MPTAKWSPKDARAAPCSTGWCLLAGVGPLLAWVGWVLLASEPVVLGSLMLLSSGGLLYLVFQDIAPQAVLRRHWFPSLGAVSGFSLALLGQLLFGA